MKKLIKVISCTLIMCLSLSLKSQNLNGYAVYKLTNITLNKDSSSGSKTSQEAKLQQMRQLEASLSGPSNRDFEIAFNKNESSFRDVESLGSAGSRGSGTSLHNNLYYRNLSEGFYEKATDIFDKPFIIHDKLPEMKWKLIDESNVFGQFQCKKAVLLDENDNPTKTTAWYTEQIPISTGPAEFYGLPGLIIVASDGRRHFSCTQVILNPKKPKEIIRPKKGDKVTQEKYDELFAEKVLEFAAIKGKN